MTEIEISKIVADCVEEVLKALEKSTEHMEFQEDFFTTYMTVLTQDSKISIRALSENMSIPKEAIYDNFCAQIEKYLEIGN